MCYLEFVVVCLLGDVRCVWYVACSPLVVLRCVLFVVCLLLGLDACVVVRNVLLAVCLLLFVCCVLCVV